MHRMKGLEFQAVRGHRRRRRGCPGASLRSFQPRPTCSPTRRIYSASGGLLFVACTRARDHLYVSYKRLPEARFLARS